MSAGRLVNIPTTHIRRNEQQPRQHFDRAAIDELAESIASQGLVQPVAVRELEDGSFELIAGERRWIASQQAGLETIPAVVHSVSDDEAQVMALVENVVRRDLSAIETARAYARLVDECGLGVAEVARAVGKSRPAVSNTMRLLELPDEVIDQVASGELSEGHGRALLGLSSRAEQRRLARLAADSGMTVRAVETAVRNAEAARVESVPESPGGLAIRTRIDPELEGEVEELCEQLFGRTPRIVPSRRAVRLELRFTSARELAEVVEQLQDRIARLHAT